MNRFFVGWDVGAWNCDRGTSRDALCALRGESFGALELVGPPWRGNLRQRFAELPGPLAGLLIEAGVTESGTMGVLAVDTPLGWPAAFVDLVGEAGHWEPVPEDLRQNPYTFRRTEMELFERGFSPLSAVRDMIGSQSSKGMYLVQKSGLVMDQLPVWRSPHHEAQETQSTPEGANSDRSSPRWEVIETYPTPARTSPKLQKQFLRLRSNESFQRRAAIGRNACSDLEDALWCALVAALWHFEPEAFEEPAEEHRGQAEVEGWIWLPADCNAPEADEQPADD